jgi:hypothetical protein
MHPWYLGGRLILRRMLRPPVGEAHDLGAGVLRGGGLGDGLNRTPEAARGGALLSIDLQLERSLAVRAAVVRGDLQVPAEERTLLLQASIQPSIQLSV